VNVLLLGRRRFAEVWELQKQLHARVARGGVPEIWIAVEHDPVVTMGRNAKEGNVLLSRELLAARGVDYHAVERGGDVTYHGPGQVVVYPIRRLARFREVVPLVRALEGAVIDACAQFGVVAERWSDHAGVWVVRDQICAVGLAVQKMTSLHGIALNVCTELSYDTLINPCGLSDRGITSLSRQTGRAVSVAEAKPGLVSAIQKTFGITLDAFVLDMVKSA